MSSFNGMAAAYPFVYQADASQERIKGMVQLGAGTSYQDFAQQLSQRVALPAGQLQVVIACSRANEFDQLQKIPVHEGTNFNVILTQHNPGRDKNVHFIVSPKMTAKERAAIAQRKAMEAARADEEAANRVVSANNSPPRYQHAAADGPGILARLAQVGALNDKLGPGLLPQYSMGTNYNRSVVLAPHGNGWTPPGSSAQVLYKNAVASNDLNNMVPHVLAGRAVAGSPDAENRVPLFTGVAPLTGPGSINTPRVTPFPEGMLRRVHEEHSSSGEGEGEFWRTSPRDRMVMGFRGPSPFGPIGTKIRAA